MYKYTVLNAENNDLKSYIKQVQLLQNAVVEKVLRAYIIFIFGNDSFMCCECYAQNEINLNIDLNFIKSYIPNITSMFTYYTINYLILKAFKYIAF